MRDKPEAQKGGGRGVLIGEVEERKRLYKEVGKKLGVGASI